MAKGGLEIGTPQGTRAPNYRDFAPATQGKWKANLMRDWLTQGERSLRSSVIRLAHAKPELRSVLLPLLKSAAAKGVFTLVLEETGSGWREKLYDPSGETTSSTSHDSAKKAFTVGSKVPPSLREGQDKLHVAVIPMKGRKKTFITSLASPEWP